MDDAIKAFLAKCKSRGIQPTTFAKYQTFANQLGAYCDRCGHRHIDQVTVTDMDIFYASWNDGLRARRRSLSASRDSSNSAGRGNGSLKTLQRTYRPSWIVCHRP